ncbi:MAG: hypothetical protein HYV28_01545 [Ignavibacteriales bacterium]|nr:hypothetical protein [Ignavibacteriales bacterium]
MGFKKPVIENFSIESAFPSSSILLVSFRDSEKREIFAKYLCGLQSADKGECTIVKEGKVISRHMLIPMNHASIPWLSVEENLKLLAADSKNSQKTADIIPKALKAVGLDGYEKHIPSPKSFEFHLRMAIAAAIVTGTELIVIDNYLSHIESKYISGTMKLIESIGQNTGICFIILNANDSLPGTQIKIQ